MPYLWLVCVLGAVVISIALDYFRNRRKWKMLESVPGFKPTFLFGNARISRLVTSRDLYAIISEFYENRLGVSRIFSEEGINKFWVGRRPFVFISKAETAEVILSSLSLDEKSDFYKLSSKWVGEGLATSSGEVWRHDRKQINPAFNFRILEDFLPIMNEQAEILVQKIKRESSGRPWIDFQEHARLCALDIILETSMGVRAEAQKGNSLYTSLVQRVTTLLAQRAFRPWLLYDFIYFRTSMGREYNKVVDQLNAMTAQIIKNRRHKREGKAAVTTSGEESFRGSNRLALLDLLLEAGLNEKQLKDQVSTFIFGGHHTISMSIVWALYIIGLHPNVQAKMVEEVDSVFGPDVTREVTLDDLKKLKYMSLVMKETQRSYPTAPVIARKLNHDTKFGNFVVPKGTDCIVMISAIHQDSKVFPDPERFDPDRFLPENAAGRHSYAYIPFSAGPRNCIGQRYAEMEVKVILCHLIRAFHFRSLDPRDKIKVIPEVNLRPLVPLRMEVSSRKSSYILDNETTD